MLVNIQNPHTHTDASERSKATLWYVIRLYWIQYILIFWAYTHSMSFFWMRLTLCHTTHHHIVHHHRAHFVSILQKKNTIKFNGVYCITVCASVMVDFNRIFLRFWDVLGLKPASHVKKKINMHTPQIANKNVENLQTEWFVCFFDSIQIDRIFECQDFLTTNNKCVGWFEIFFFFLFLFQICHAGSDRAINPAIFVRFEQETLIKRSSHIIVNTIVVVVVTVK